MTEYQGRSHYEAGRQKQNLYKIGIAISKIKRDEFTADEFSTDLVFNFMVRPLNTTIETKLPGFAELDNFLSYDINELYDFFEFRFRNYKSRLIRPK
jgi:hypothetical protein